MKVDIIIKHALIVAVDTDDTVIENGVIAIVGGTIHDIGGNELLQKYSSEKTIDAKGKLVMPGLINSHTHISMTIFRGMADDMPLQKWLNEFIFPAEAKFLNRKNVELGARIAIHEMIHSGTTCFADMYYFSDNIATICKEYGIRCLLSEGLLDFPVPNNPTPQDALDYTEMMLKKYQSDELVSIALGPHSPYTCSPEWLKKARILANKYDVPFHIHLSETKWEFDQCMQNNGCSPLVNLDRQGLLEGKTLAAHCVTFTQDDVELMAKRGVCVVHNPQSNMKLASGVAPISAMLKAGGIVALGTDGVVSNNNLDMFAEMKAGALLQKSHFNDPSLLAARDVVRMATIMGAKALGMEKRIGSIEKGKKADLIFVDITKPHTIPLYNVYSQIVYSINSGDVDTVIVNGAIVMENKTLNVDDFGEVSKEMAALSQEISRTLLAKN